MEWRYLVWGATQEASLKVSSEAQNSFLIKNCIEPAEKYQVQISRKDNYRTVS